MRDYFGGHNHTEYSNVKVIDSINRFNRMVDYAWDLNLSGIALTDHDCLSGSLQALDIYKAKLKKEWMSVHPDATETPGWAEMSKELDFKINLKGKKQVENAAVAYETLQILNKNGFNIKDNIVLDSF